MVDLDPPVFISQVMLMVVRMGGGSNWLRITFSDCSTVLKILNFCLKWKASQRYKVKVKVKPTLEQATKAQRGSRDIALLFL